MNTQLLAMHTPLLSLDFRKQGFWHKPTHYGRVYRNAQLEPDVRAVSDLNVELTWRQFIRWADAVAGELHQRGLRAGDTVALWMPKGVHAEVVHLACSRNGYRSLQADQYCEEPLCFVSQMKRSAASALFVKSQSDEAALFDEVQWIENGPTYFIEPALYSAVASPKAMLPFPDIDDFYALPAPQLYRTV